METNLKNKNILKRAYKILSDIFGYSEFREGQKDIIENIIRNKNSLVVMPTGAGKSLCYQIPAMVSHKKTVVISPLIALIDDQVSSLNLLGINVSKLHSNLSKEESVIAWNDFINGKSKIIYISPERLMTDYMTENLKSLDIGLFIIDEIHCVSKWGQSFRPDYEKLSKLKNLFPNSTIAGFTATADKTTRIDILNKIFSNKATLFVKGFDRPNLSLSVKEKSNWKSQLTDFIESRRDLSGVIYCLSRKKTEEVSGFLNKKGFNTSPYHAGLDGETRKKIQNTFMTETSHIVVATIAFGMGIDKPDIRFVVHLNLPSSMEAYYQEIGRAGRDGYPADTLLIYGLDDLIIRRKMIEESNSDKDFKFNENKRLDYLLSYCESPQCRRKTLLGYFDDTSNKCDNCDNCINPPKLTDGTVLAQKLLSTIFRTGQFFGQVHIINVLRGSKDKKIIDKRHDNLSVYGIGKDKSINFWQSFLRQLLAFGHLQINFQKYGAIQITDSGINILKNRIKFFYKDVPEQLSIKINKKVKKEVIELDEVKIDLLKSLKALRLKFANEQNLPAYTIFHDITLIKMSKILPKNKNELLKIDGVGQAKLKKYGKEFLKIINN